MSGTGLPPVDDSTDPWNDRWYAMMWQDLVFLAGSVFSIVVLVPTLRDSMAHVPLGTALPSAGIGVVYGVTFATLGMTFSAAGALLTGLVWSLIAVFRSPTPFLGGLTGTEHSYSDAPRGD